MKRDLFCVFFFFSFSRLDFHWTPTHHHHTDGETAHGKCDDEFSRVATLRASAGRYFFRIQRFLCDVVNGVYVARLSRS